jgi:hypothetical protein
MREEPQPPLYCPDFDLPLLREVMKDVHQTALDLRSFSISFLAFLLYINVTVASTNHEQLLRESPVRLPLLDVPVPIIGFYIFVPVLLVFVHTYVLLQNYLFSKQLYRFEDLLRNEAESTQVFYRQNLSNLPFLH